MQAHIDFSLFAMPPDIRLGSGDGLFDRRFHFRVRHPLV
jgi:hypothetical protein